MPIFGFLPVYQICANQKHATTNRLARELPVQQKWLPCKKIGAARVSEVKQLLRLITTGNSGQQPEAAKRLVFRFLSQSPDAMDCLTRDLYGTLDAHSSEQTGFLPRKVAVRHYEFMSTHLWLEPQGLLNPRDMLAYDL